VNPYEVLGVARSAHVHQIRSAYRAKAKTLHPDAGGGAAEFAELGEAFAILSNPDRRRHFDRTGSTDHKLEQSPDHDAIGLIAGKFQRVLALADIDVCTLDIVGQFVGAFREEIDQLQRNRKNPELALARIAKMRGRFKRKASNNQNIFDAFMAQHDRAAKDVIASIEKEIALRNRAIEILNDHEYNFEQQLMMSGWYTTTASTSTT